MFFKKIPKTIEEIFDSLLTDRFYFCDVGARDGLAHPWSLFKKYISTISFEPDPDEYTSLLSKLNHNDLLLQNALAEINGSKNFYLTKNRGCSSLYRPNSDLLNNFPDHDRFTIERTLTIDTVKLDDLIQQNKINTLHFIKLDTQGSELDILKGALPSILKNLVGIELEVEFQEMYKGQPTFSEVDQFIRTNFDMQLMDLRQTHWKYSSKSMPGSPKGQLIFGDALYFFNLLSLENKLLGMELKNAQVFLHHLLLTSFVYGFLDYTLHVLNLNITKKIFQDETIQSWKKIIQLSGNSISPYIFKGHRFTKIIHTFSDFVYSIYRLFQRTHESWGTSSGRLGSIKRWLWFE